MDFRSHPDGCALCFLGKEVQFPAFLQEAVAFVASADTFTSGEIPNCPDEEAKVVLVRRLVREGLLQRGGERGSRR